MVKGLVAILDDTTQQRVRDLWAEFHSRFGAYGVSVTPYPHFSFHVAEEYDGKLLENLESFTSLVEPLTVSTAGIGIFTGEVPVIHLNVVRRAALSRLHKAAWELGERFAQNSLSYYTPDNWIPHITLAQGDFTQEQIPKVIDMLQTRDFSWEVQVVGIGILANHQTSPTISYMLR